MTPDRRAGFTGVWDITLGQGSLHPIPVVNEYRWVDPPAPLPIVLKLGEVRPSNATQNGFEPWDEAADISQEAIGKTAFFYVDQPVVAACAAELLATTPASKLKAIESDAQLAKLNGGYFPYTKDLLLQRCERHRNSPNGRLT